MANKAMIHYNEITYHKWSRGKFACYQIDHGVRWKNTSLCKEVIFKEYDDGDFIRIVDGQIKYTTEHNLHEYLWHERWNRLL